MPLVESKEDLLRYREFLEQSKFTRPMQDPNWALVKENWTSDLVYVEENKQIKAALSVIGIKNDNGKHFLYAPRGPVCDFRDFDLVEELIEEASPLKEKYDAFLLRIDPEFIFQERAIYEYRKRGFEFRSLCEHIRSFTQPRYNMVVDTKGLDKDSIFDKLSKKARYGIRKSIRSEIITKEETNQKTLDIFYNLTEIMAKRKGINYRPKDYFQRLVDHMDARIFVSYYENLALSSCILIPYKDKVYYLYAASSDEMRNKMPNYNMVWEAIKWTISNGYRYFDMGGVFVLDKSDGLYMFKEHFCHPNKYTAYIGELDVVYDREKYENFLR